MPHPENIIPPVKGEIRNPKGKPVGTKNRKTLLRKWLELNASVLTPITGEQQTGTIEDAVNIALIKKALEGDVNAIKEINDTLYGKITEKHDIAGSIGIESISVKVKRLDGTGT